MFFTLLIYMLNFVLIGYYLLYDIYVYFFMHNFKLQKLAI